MSDNVIWGMRGVHVEISLFSNDWYTLADLFPDIQQAPFADFNILIVWLPYWMALWNLLLNQFVMAFKF